MFIVSPIGVDLRSDSPMAGSRCIITHRSRNAQRKGCFVYGVYFISSHRKNGPSLCQHWSRERVLLFLRHRWLCKPLVPCFRLCSRWVLYRVATVPIGRFTIRTDSRKEKCCVCFPRTSRHWTLSILIFCLRESILQGACRFPGQSCNPLLC